MDVCLVTDGHSYNETILALRDLQPAEVDIFRTVAATHHTVYRYCCTTALEAPCCQGRSSTSSSRMLVWFSSVANTLIRTAALRLSEK